MTEIAALGLKIEGVSNVDQATASLGKFSSSANKAQGSADKLGNESSSSSKQVAELGNATNKTSLNFKELSASATKAGAAVGVAAAAAVAAITAMTVSTVRQANEITKLSLFSGTTTDEFQKLAAAANLVGVEQDKLADIFKDTQDKIGDFLQSGAGELNDFFEKIAPKVGVTADSFRGLSGPDALGLYVSSLEKAGVSQGEMVFYLEAIANDSTALLPLLKDNAAGFRELGEMAAQAGAIMDRDTIRAAKEMSAVMWQADIALGGMKDQMMKGLLPALSGVATAMMGVSTNTAIAEDAGRTLGVVVKGLAATATGAYAAFNLLGKSIAGAFAVADSADVTTGDLLLGGPAKIAYKLFKGRDKVQQTAEIVKEDLTKTVEDFGKVLDGIWSAGEGGDTDSATKRIADLLEQQSKLYKGLGTSISSVTSEQEKAAKEAAKAEQAIASQISALERARDVWGMSADAVVLYDLKQQGATETQLKYANSLLETVAALEKQKEAEEAAAAAREAAGEKFLDVMKELSNTGSGIEALDQLNQQYAERYEIISNALATEYATQQEHDAAMLALEETTAAERKRILEEFETDRQAKQMETMASIVTITQGQIDTMKGLFDESTAIGKAFFVASQALAAANAIIQGYQSAMAIRTAYAQMAAATANPLAAGMGEIHAATAQAMGFVTAGAIAAQTVAGFERGGYTGNMGRKDVAGVVHGQEFVMNAATTARVGLPTLEAIQAGRPVPQLAGNTSNNNSRSVTVQQTNYISGDDSNRTANQIARATARKERMVNARLG